MESQIAKLTFVMKFTLKTVICSFVLFCCSTSSFSKSILNTPPTAEVILLKKLSSKVLGNENEYSFVYKENKLVKITFSIFNGATQKGYYKFIYVGDVITKIQEFTAANNLVYTSTFGYSNDQLTSIVKEEIGKNKAEKISFSYNSNGSVTSERRIGTSSQQNKLIETEYLYFEGNKLVKKVENGVTSNAVIFEYDRANHPLKNVVGMGKIYTYLNSSFGIFASSGLEGIQNNRVKQTFFTAGGVLDYVSVFKISYSNNNYPINKMSAPDSPGAFEYIYSYY